MRGSRAAAVTILIAGSLVVTPPATSQGPTCAGRDATILAVPGVRTIGTPGDDVIVGTRGADVIRGRGGDDVICGRGGADEIRGNTGQDVLIGGRGDDRLRGGRADDWLRGRRGDDVLRGGAGSDSCGGGPGADRVIGCEAPTTTPPPVPTPLPTPTVTPTPTPPSAGVTFTAVGDYGVDPGASPTLAGIGAAAPDFNLALGDMSYGEPGEEASWCSYVQDLIGDTPFQLVAGNHEDDEGFDGHINDFAACLPDRMGSTGIYGAEYWFDVDDMVRVIMIAADSTVNGVTYDYQDGNARYAWLETAIDSARSAGLPWVVVGMHKVCFSAGAHDCEIGQDLVDLLMEKRVDLVLSGHEHSYQRSKQLTCAVASSFVPACVADSGADGQYGKDDGTVWVVAGNSGGRPMSLIFESDPEHDYFAAWHGADSPDPGGGFLQVTLTAVRMDATWVGTSTSYTDSFTIE